MFGLMYRLHIEGTSVVLRDKIMPCIIYCREKKGKELSILLFFFLLACYR